MKILNDISMAPDAGFNFRSTLSDGINKNTGSQMITGIFSYCQIILLLIKEKSFVQTIEARTVTGFILCHFMNCVMDSIKTKLFCP